MPELQVKDAAINKIYKPSDVEQNWRTWVYQRYYEMRFNSQRQLNEKEWLFGEQQWDAYRKPREEEDWQSNYVIPLTTSVVESILAEYVDQRLRPLILARGDEDVVRAEIMSHMFDYTCDVGDFDLEFYNVLKSTLIRGTAFAQEYYLKDRRMVKDIMDLSKLAKNRYDFNTKEREVYEYDDEKMEYVSNWDMYWDEKSLDFNRGPKKARDAARRYVMNIRDFRTFFTGPVWDPMGNVRFVKPGGDTSYYQYYRPYDSIDHKEDVEVLWYWSRSPEDALIIMANDVPIRIGPNIFKHKQIPFAKAVDVPRLDQFCGKGEPKLLESIQEELDTLRRMTIDRHHLDLDKSFLVSRTSQLDDEDLIARPHAMIPVDDPKNVRPLEYGDIPGSVQLTQRAINEDSVRVTGVDDRAQALQKAPTTATEAAILKEATLKRIKMKIMLISKGFLTDISRQRVANIMQFYSQPTLEKIAGEKRSEEYKNALNAAMQDGSLEVRDSVPYKKVYRQVPLKGKKLAFDERGKMNLQENNGPSFFEAKPEFFLPVCRGGFDLKFEPSSTLPISKPLQQSKMTEMFDRLIPLTQNPQTKYSAEKVADMLVKINDYNPNDFKVQATPDQGQVSDNRMGMAIGLADRENKEVIKGQPIPENGTPFAPPAHTEVHIALLQSEMGKKLPEAQYKILVKHAMGEVLAQKVRQQGPDAAMQDLQGQGGGAPDQVPQGGAPAQGPSEAPMNNAGGNIMPSKIQGAPQVPNGLPLGPGR
jgi:hypothetical protein